MNTCRMVLVLGLTLSIFGTAATQTRNLLLLDLTPTLNRQLTPDNLKYTDGKMAVVEISAEEVETWSRKIHEEMGACGGFLDVTEEIRSGMGPEALVAQEQQKRRSYQHSQPRKIEMSRSILQLVNKVDAGKTFAFLQELSAFPDRSASSDNGVNAAEFLKTRATQYAGGFPGFQAELISTGFFYKQPSLVVKYAGTDPSLPAIVIGGHMDTYSNNKPGADDDGSGSSIVMEALRVVSSQSAKFKRDIYFAWYAAEERGLVGSKYVVKHFQKRSINVGAAIQFDMVGWNSTSDNEDVFLITDNTDAGLNQTLKGIIANYTQARVGETACGYACSDHANWHRAGVPVVFPFESSFDNMNQKLHTSSDTHDHLDAKHMEHFARIAVAFLAEMGELVNR